MELGFFKRYFGLLIYGGFVVFDFFSQSILMSSLEDKKHVSAPKVVLMMSKITEDKLTSPNYFDWSKTIRLYIKHIRMTSHLTKDPPTDDSKE